MALSDWLLNAQKLLKSITRKDGKVTVNLEQAQEIIQQLPLTVSDSQLNAFLSMSEKFLDSRQAKMLPDTTRKLLRDKIASARRLSTADAWKSLRAFMNDYRNLSKLAEPLLLFILDDPAAAPEWLLDLVK